MAGSSRSLGFELQRQAFGQIARADADRIEALQHAQHRLDILDLGAQPVGDFVEIGAQIARFVDAVDQGQADQAVVRRSAPRSQAGRSR